MKSRASYLWNKQHWIWTLFFKINTFILHQSACQMNSCSALYAYVTRPQVFTVGHYFVFKVWSIKKKKKDQTKDKHVSWGINNLENRAKEMLADDDRTKSGSTISRLVTTQRASVKEILRARKGIRAMMPGKTDFCDRNNTHMHSLYLLRVFICLVCKQQKPISCVHPGI